jgi:hypothetical protein
MRRAITIIALGGGLAGCASMGVSDTESRLTQAGFRQMPADTPKRVEHLQTLPPYKLIKRTTGGKSYYVFADPSGCKCLYVGAAAAYAKYKTLVQQQQDAMALEEQREDEGFEGVGAK